jgi:hypothetical protein
MNIRRSLFALVIVLFFVTLGCVSIPRETVQLSSELGMLISESRSAHLALVRQYMSEKRERIDEFMFREWIPEFARQVFKQENIEKEWERIVGSNDRVERLEFVTGLGVRLQQKINSKRQEVMKPVNELELLLVARINDHYDEMLAANSSLTVFLESASKVKAIEQEMMKKLHIDDKLSRMISSADKVVDKIIEGRDAYEKNRDKIEKIIDELRKG